MFSRTLLSSRILDKLLPLEEMDMLYRARVPEQVLGIKEYHVVLFPSSQITPTTTTGSKTAGTYTHLQI